MRLKAGSRTSEQDEALQNNTADFVLQVGNMKVPLKADKLLGGSVRVSSKTDMPLKAEKLLGPPALNEEDKAIEAFERMQEAFSGPAQGQRTGSWAPWSPDDMYPHDMQSNTSTHIGTSRNAPEPLRREPSDANLPGYYDPAVQQSSNIVSKPAPVPASRDGAAPTIFDNLSGPQTPNKDTTAAKNMKHFEASRRSSKTTSRPHSTRPRKLDLVQLLPQPRPSGGRILSSRLSSSPSSLHDRADNSRSSTPTEAPESNSGRSKTTGRTMMRNSTSSGGKQKVFDEATLDQHKTNRRRPPKGIQNWFDAYLESDEDEDEEDDDDDEEEEFQEIAPPSTLPEPQELPADELPPAYSAPSREISRASEKSGSYTRSSREQNTVREEMERYRNTNDCHSWDSIQSSHIGRLAPDNSNERLAASPGPGQSVMSLSESEYTDDVHTDEGARMPAIRDSIMDDRVVTIASASSIDLHNMHKAHLEQTRNSFGTRESRGSLYSLENSQIHQLRSPRDRPHTSAESTALRQLTRAEVDVPSNRSETTLHESFVGPSDASHIMAVTEEEKMILDMMRRKRTEGYQLALQAEQQRIAQQGTPAERDALRTLQREIARRDSEVTTMPSPADTADMRRQLSAIRKESVDGRFQIERFLGAAEPRPMVTYPADGPVELPTNRMSGELLPATVYSPAGTPSVRSPAFNQDAFQSPDPTADAEDIKRRVEQFIATKGAVPPLNTQMKLMQRQPKGRRGSSMPPSPVKEEEQPQQYKPPAIPKRSPERGHTRGISDLTSKVSSVSLDGEPRSDSPVSAFPTATDSDIPIHFQDTHLDRPQPLQPNRHDITSQPNQNSVSASPFSCLIKAASTSKLLLPSDDGPTSLPSTAGTTVTPENATDIRASSQANQSTQKPHTPPPPRKLQSPVSRYNNSSSNSSDVTTEDNSREDVLAAWHNLGGATEGLNVKRQVKPRASGPLSGIMNA